MRARVLFILCGMFYLAFAYSLTALSATEATFSVQVPPGKWKALRVKNLPSGAFVEIEAEVNGPVSVTFVNRDDYRRFPSPAQPLFSGQFDRRFSFSVTIPTASDYYLVFDNRPGGDARTVSVTVRGSRGRSTERSTGEEGPRDISQQSIQAFQENLDEFKGKLNQIFIFEPVPLLVKKCGLPRAFATEIGIVLCAEYAQKLYETLGDKEKAGDALLFTIFHEYGHVLLRQWDFPAYENEELADEFATTTMIFLGMKDRIRAKAEFFAATASATESLAKTFKDDRHPLSAQRARNILRWAKDPEIVRKWQTIFIPHLQTAVLKKFEGEPSFVFDRELIEKELAARR